MNLAPSLGTFPYSKVVVKQQKTSSTFTTYLSRN